MSLAMMRMILRHLALIYIKGSLGLTHIMFTDGCNRVKKKLCFIVVMYRYHIFNRYRYYYRYQHLEPIPILPIPPILFHLLGTINKSFCKQHQRMHLLNLACFYIWNIFYIWYLSLFITILLQI